MAKKEELDSLSQALADFNTYDEPEVLKLKSKVLNGVLGGGLPVGSVIQLAAGSGSGKSTIALDISRELCQQGKKVLYIDVEKGLNPSNLKGTGVEPFRLKGTFVPAQEYKANKIYNLIRACLPKDKRGKALVDCIVLDSLGAINVGLYDDDKADITVQRVGGSTKTLKALMIEINGIAIDHKITFIIINHTQKDINAFFPTENPVGGSAPIYLSDVVIKLTPLGKPLTNSKGIPVAQKVQAEAIKSRFGIGKVKRPFYICLGKGISNLYTYLDILQELDTEIDGKTKKMLTITPGSSSNHLYLDGKDYTFQGKDNAIEVIKQHYNEIDKFIDDKYFVIDNGETVQPVLISESEDEEIEDLSELEELD